MMLKVRGTRQLFTAPKGEKGDKGDKGDNGNSFTPKGQAHGHFDSVDDFDDAMGQGLLNYGQSYLVDDDDESGTAKVYTIAIRRIGIVEAEDGDAYTIVNTKHLWAATGNKWVDFGEIQGPKGDQGAAGPMGIPVGAYNNSTRYERTSEIVPIVEHNGEYWYPRNEGVLTNSEPSASNNDWKKAENFEVMFVKILFAAFAKLGEAIFHGNFMFSQNGKVNGTASNNYQLFSPSDPDNEGNAARFAPNLYLNFMTGAARLAAGKAKFNADGSGSLAGERIEWDDLGMKLAGVLYKKKTVITPSNLSQYMTVVGTFVENGETKNLYALDVMKAGTWIELNGIRPGVYFKLPSMRWDGTYTEAEKNLARSLVGCSVIISTVDSNICGFRDTHMRYYDVFDISSGNRYTLDDDSPNAANMIIDYRYTVYLECVLADVKDSNGWYREDIRWDARVVKENS